MGKESTDVSRFVAIGDSITSGYADGALYYEAQLNSYANLLAAQLKWVGGGDFRQALMEPGSVGVGFTGNSRLILKKQDKRGAKPQLDLSFLAPKGDLSALYNNQYTSRGAFQNMGVPGGKAVTALYPGYGNPENGPGNFNPFFTRMASDPKTASILSDALQQEPTFFSLFIGNNDVLAFALSGGTGENITPPKGPAGIGFDNSIYTIVDSLTSNGAKGVIANLPSITSIPFFTTIPYNGLVLDRAEANQLNEKYRISGFHFSEGPNAFIAEDPATGLRQLEKGELVLMDILLDADKISLMNGNSPLPKKYFLAMHEVAVVRDVIQEYNHILRSAAESRGLAFVDVNGLLKKVKAERVYHGISVINENRKRGIFSLDGLHLNPLGHTFLANEFIKSSNAAYGLQIPGISFSHYRKLFAEPNAHLMISE